MKNLHQHQLYHNYASPEQVKDEIEQIEKRIRQIGHDGGDCSYEKAMVRFFEEQMEHRHEWLDSLPG